MTNNSLAVTGAEALGTVRELLAKCPDESPLPGTAELAFISDALLRESIRNDISSANRALHDGLWKAATVLSGAAAEALLLWAIMGRRSQVERDNARLAVIPKANRDPSRWGLDEYIKVARELVLIDDDTKQQAHLARRFRDLIHPGRAARTEMDCGPGTAHGALAAAQLIVKDLLRKSI